MIENIDNTIRETTFYKHYMEVLKNIIDSYESPEEFNIDKLNEEDLDKMIIELYDDNYFNRIVDENIQYTLESYENNNLFNR